MADGRPRSMRRWVIWTLFTGTMFGVMVGAFLGLTHDLPQVRFLEDYKPPAVTRVWSSDNQLLAELFSEKRVPVSLHEIPSALINAFIATEDRNFFRHSGVDLKGILRALVKDIWAGEFVEGASTITQQLAKTLFLSSQKTVLRKVKEAILSIQIERKYTKDEILTLYLNQVYFGSGAYGVYAAAQTFFGKTPNQVTLAECALIAAMVKAPSRYSPLINMELALERRNIVLKQMAETGMIDKETYDVARKERVGLPSQRVEPSTKAPYFVQFIADRLEDEIGPSRLYREGLSVKTTLSFELQSAAESALQRGLSALAQRRGGQRNEQRLPEGAIIVIDVSTGGILAMVGGKDFSKSPFNRAVSAVRQPGSAFKPILFAYALEQGFAQNTLLLDAPATFKEADNGKDWLPKNFTNRYQGEITFREALTRSINLPAVRLMEKLGPDAVIAFAYRLGIRTPLESNLSLALGTSGVRLIDLTAAYAVFANKGCRTPPYGVLEVTGEQGRIVWRETPQKRMVMSPANAAVITDILQGVIKEGTGKKALELRRTVAGKTGSSDQFRDALFIGFSPTIAVGVWVGLDENESLGPGETGAKAALPIWMDFMANVPAQAADSHFTIPADVVALRMDPSSGRLLSPEDKTGFVVLFKREM